MSKQSKKPQAKKRLLRAARLRVMPLTMAMLSLLLVAKLNELYLNSRQLSELLDTRDAYAEDKKEAEKADAAAEKPKGAELAVKEAKGEDSAKKEEASGEHEGGEAKPEEEPKTYGAGKLTVKQVEALKAKAEHQPYSQTELDLLQNLAKRRAELDTRAKDLDMKSSVLEATEKRINDKIVEMKALEKELKVVIAEYKQQQDSEVMSLVKIYENMKPLDAAAIFNEMDMPILLEVIGKMSERKVAPVLAGMDPKRARDVTQELAELRKSRPRLNSALGQTAN